MLVMCREFFSYSDFSTIVMIFLNVFFFILILFDMNKKKFG